MLCTGAQQCSPEIFRTCVHNNSFWNNLPLARNIVRPQSLGQITGQLVDGKKSTE